MTTTLKLSQIIIILYVSEKLQLPSNNNILHEHQTNTMNPLLQYHQECIITPTIVMILPIIPGGLFFKTNNMNRQEILIKIRKSSRNKLIYTDSGRGNETI